MLNHIWLGLILLAVLIGGFTGRMSQVSDASMSYAKDAVVLCLGLIGTMALWLGVMRLAERAGLVQLLARVLRPIMRWLFPDVPADHPAQGAMVMNIAANMIGVSNAATPLGIKAMKYLEKLNPHPGTASNAMCTFLTINTGSVQLVPATAIAMLASAGSKNPTAIISTAFLATLFATCAGIFAAKVMEKWRIFRAPVIATNATASDAAGKNDEIEDEVWVEPSPVSSWGRISLTLLFLCSVLFTFILAFPESFGFEPTEIQRTQTVLVRFFDATSKMAIPFMLAFFPLYGAARKIKVYEEFVEGAKDGFNVAVRIIPYLVTILFAIGMFRAAGGIDLLQKGLKPLLDAIHFPPELLPMSIMRSLSGSGSQAILGDLIKVHGPDDIITRMAATIYGSTETTFYVIAVYFGAVAIRRTRHAIAAGLFADAVGVIASIIICRMMFG
ncbi:MAG: nucleoside recognition domain-containing protein [Verrucomicrobiota bacterium]